MSMGARHAEFFTIIRVYNGRPGLEEDEMGAEG